LARRLKNTIHEKLHAECLIHDKISLMTRIDDLDLPYETDLTHVQIVTNQDLLAHISRVGKVIYERSQ